MPKFVTGWRVDRACRDQLLKAHPPRYGRAVADHVTLQAGVAARADPPPPARCRIVGEADDGRGVQAMVVEIDGDTARPDGGTFHITWSLDEGRRAVESNEVIAARGWRPLDPLPVEVKPERFAL